MLSVSGGVVLPQVGHYSSRRGPICSGISRQRLEMLLVFFRECQVKHWPKHKKACTLLAEATEKIKSSSDIDCSRSDQ